LLLQIFAKIGDVMKTKLSRFALFRSLERVANRLAEHRNCNAPNFQYPVASAALTAFGAFYLQQPSLLCHEGILAQKNYYENFLKLFHRQPVISSQTLRNILDHVNPQSFIPAFDDAFNRLDRSGLLGHLAFNEQMGLLLSGDGVDYFSSEEISCANCNHAHHEQQDGTERIVYSHKMFNVGIVHPTENMFIPLNPEFMTPQDGSKKQDCEQNGAKRWLTSFRKRHKTVRATLLVDALHSNHGFLTMVLDHRLQFIATCKPLSCKTLYEWVNTARKGKDTTIVEQRKIIKGKSVLFRYEYLNNVPIRDTEDALRVNFISMCEIDPKTEKVLHRFEYITSLTVKDSNVEKLILAGRKRWKVENEGNNTLKNQGYYFDHNFGHGKKHLSAVIATLIVFSFLVHTILRLVGQDGIVAVQKECYARKKCIEILRSSSEHHRVSSWEDLYATALKAVQENVRDEIAGGWCLREWRRRKEKQTQQRCLGLLPKASMAGVCRLRGLGKSRVRAG
jgi:hypothetical protein